MEELLIQNEWWETGKISKGKALPYRRKVFKEIKKTFLSYRQIFILTGLRRVGKTTMVYQIIDELLKKNIDPRRIVYFSFDKKVEDITEILKAYQKITKINWKKEKIYLFLDEVQKLENWSSKIKLIYDSLPNIKIFLTGSASLMLESEALANLTGRYFIREIKPLTLQEYAELYYEKRIENFELYIHELEAVFDDYIKKPFPEIVKLEDDEKIREYVKSIVVEKILAGDILVIFKKINLNLLRTLADIVFRNPGMIFNTDELSRKFHVHKLTLKEHLHYLEFGNLIRVVKNFRPSVMAESRKLPKVYPFHPAFCFAFFAEVEKGKIYENLVMHLLDLRNYYRQGVREIDFIKRNGDIIPIEVKSKKEIGKKDIKNMVWFLKKFGLKKGFLVTRYGEEDKIKIDGQGEIEIMPLMRIAFNPENLLFYRSRKDN